eukprot:g276.t1
MTTRVSRKKKFAIIAISSGSNQSDGLKRTAFICLVVINAHSGTALQLGSNHFIFFNFKQPLELPGQGMVVSPRNDSAA